MRWIFNDPGLLAKLAAADDALLDTAPFGVVAMGIDGKVISYNEAETRLSGLPRSNVIGRHFFSGVAPCTNNYMVSYRFETEPEIDVIIDYVFTLRMQPTSVRLRLLKHPDHQCMFLVIERA